MVRLIAQREAHGHRITQAGARHGAHEHDGRELQAREFLGEVVLIVLRRELLLHQIPLVHHDHGGLEGLGQLAGELLLDLAALLGGVQQQPRHVGARDGVGGARVGVELDVAVPALALAHAGGVDQGDGALAHLDAHVHAVARGAGDLAHDHAGLTRQLVHDAALARVAATHDGHAQVAARRLLVDVVHLLGQARADEVAQSLQSVAALGADADGVAEAEARGFLRGGLEAAVIGLVGHQQRLGGVAALAQQFGHRAIQHHHAVAHIDGEQDHVRHLGGRHDLVLDVGGEIRQVLACVVDAVLLGGVHAPTAGIDHFPCACRAVRGLQRDGGRHAIARDAGRGIHDGDALASQPVEQAALADIGTTEDGEARKHGQRMVRATVLDRIGI